MNTSFLILFFIVGGLLIGLSLPLIYGKVPPNLSYGFRVRRTLDDPSIWYPANAYAGWQILWVGVVGMVVAVATYLIPNVELGVYTSIVGVTYGVGVVVMLVRSFVYLGKLPK
ncbi:SdpI family protein [Neorhodopirellula lusitana]|uniref:SdpI family protein n=1 Tax=Neorhodopirellula lusitana TaxID=445327 RepID=UPI00384C2D91